MEIRKVQLTGGSSYVVTLPKEWITSNEIKKNDPIGLTIQHDGSLLISPRIEEKQNFLIKEISLDGIEQEDVAYIHRLLIGAYVAGYNQIVLTSNTRVDPFIRESVITFIQHVIGPELIDEDTSSMTIKDLLSPVEMPFKNTIKRMHMIVKSMHRDIFQALDEGDVGRAEEIIERDKDVDKLNWLIHRQYNLISSDMGLSKKMNVTHKEALLFFTIGRIMERIGDHAVIIANNIPLLDRKKLGKEMISLLIDASGLSLKILDLAMDARKKEDMKMANQCIEMQKQLTEKCNDLADDATKISGASSVALSYISESIRRTGMYGTDISEMVINTLITDKTE